MAGEHKRNPVAQAAAAGLIGQKKNGGGPQNINIDLNDLERLGCRECGGTDFVIRLNIWEVPELLRPFVGGNRYLNRQVHSCLSCGASQAPEEMQRLPPLRAAGATADCAAGQEAEGPAAKPMIEVVR